MSKRSPAVLIGDMVQALELVEQFVSGMDATIFVRDEKTVHAVCRCLEILGEAANRAPPDVRERLPEVPWPQLIALRNRLIHAYFDVNRDVVWTIATEDAPALLRALRHAHAAVDTEREA